MVMSSPCCMVVLLLFTVVLGVRSLDVLDLDGTDWIASAFLEKPRAKNCSFVADTDFKPHGGGSSGYNSGKVADAQTCCTRSGFVTRH